MANKYDKYIKSTGTHYISNSGHDENSNYKNGKAGDQTGHEWELRSWYNRPWSCILRYPNQDVALLATKLAIEAALNNNIGYDQYQRKTFWKELEAAGYDPSQIQKACESDCTAGVVAIWKAVGYILNIPELKNLSIDIYSGNMKSAFKKAGFTVLTATKYRTSGDYIYPGDVCLYEGHHAATNITLGKKATGWNPGIIPPKTDDVQPIMPGLGTLIITGGSVNVRTAPSKTAKSLKILHKGDILTYQGQTSEDGNWYLVIFDNQNAWVSKKYSEVNDKKVVITGGIIHFRSEPNASSKSYDYVHLGDIYPYGGNTSGNWNQIIKDGKVGWVSGKYSKIQ